MVSAIVTNDQANILSRAIDAHNGDWSEEMARGILSIKLSPFDTDRMHTLAKLARTGELSHQEEIEIEHYRQATGLLDLLRAKAHVSLHRIDERR